LWSHDGRELFFMSLDGYLMGTPVETRGTFTVGNPVLLFEATPITVRLGAGRPFDVARDGRFLFAKDEDVAAETPRLQVVLNWFHELTSRVPTE
jgi:hypothetical protein